MKLVLVQLFFVLNYCAVAEKGAQDDLLHIWFKCSATTIQRAIPITMRASPYKRLIHGKRVTSFSSLLKVDILLFIQIRFEVWVPILFSSAGGVTDCCTTASKTDSSFRLSDSTEENIPLLHLLVSLSAIQTVQIYFKIMSCK